MSRQVQQEPAYVLHRRPYRETGLLLDLFTLNHGKVGVVARGASGPRSPLKGQLQPFVPLLVDWTGRSDLKTLTHVESRTGVQLGQGRALFSGFYLNELLQKLLSPFDPAEPLFAAYLEALERLAAAPDDVEPVLRHFEMQLADGLGYGFCWDFATDSGQPVQAEGSYCYDPEQGIVATATDTVRLTGLSGQTLLALAQGDLNEARCRRTAKRVMRVLTDFLLQGKPLNSRALFASYPETNLRNGTKP